MFGPCRLGQRKRRGGRGKVLEGLEEIWKEKQRKNGSGRRVDLWMVVGRPGDRSHAREAHKARPIRSVECVGVLSMPAEWSSAFEVQMTMTKKRQLQPLHGMYGRVRPVWSADLTDEYSMDSDRY